MDEADKMLVVGESSSRPGVAYELQANFLKIIEGDEYHGTDADGNEFVVDTSRISVILMGSFEVMLKNKGFGRSGSFGVTASVKAKEQAKYEEKITQDDLVRYANMRQEMAGRIDDIVQLYPMTAEDYITVVKTPKMSPLDALEREYGCTIDLPDEDLEKMAEAAEKSKMGVRHIKAQIVEALDNEMFETPGKDNYTLKFENER